AGGSITGEHGVGLDKRQLLPLIFSDDDMDTMLRVRAAFDPSGLCNPGKIIPVLRGCGEARVIQTKSNGKTERRGDAGTRAWGEEEQNGTASGSERVTEPGRVPFPIEHDANAAAIAGSPSNRRSFDFDLDHAA